MMRGEKLDGLFFFDPGGKCAFTLHGHIKLPQASGVLQRRNFRAADGERSLEEIVKIARVKPADRLDRDSETEPQDHTVPAVAPDLLCKKPISHEMTLQS